MRTRTVERVEDWDSRPFSGGFRELHELADDGFTGAIVADETWLFMLNGRVVGAFEGDINDFEDATGTVYAAPDPALPLLFSMQERGGNTQARYYTNDTPISEADDTLSDANFTGYIELSENVLSGDYYVVYYGGRSMATAFVGASEDLVSGEEAFERADDEVGVYEVKKVSMNITDIPEPAEKSEPADAAAAAETAGVAEAVETDAGTSNASTTEPSPESQSTEATTESDADAASADAESTASSQSDVTVGTGDRRSTTDVDQANRTKMERTEAAEGGQQSESISDAGSADRGSSEQVDENQAAEMSVESTASETETPQETGTSTETAEMDAEPAAATETTSSAETSTAESAAESSDSNSESPASDDVFSEEEQWRETTSIPALDPDKSGPRQADVTENGGRVQKRRQEAAQQGGERARTQSRSKEKSGRTRQSKPDNQSQADRHSRAWGESKSKTETSEADAPSDSTLERLKRAVKKREDRIEELSSQVEALESEREDLQDTLEELQAERDQLTDRVEELEADLEAAKEAGAGTAPSANDLSPEDALAGTNLFVRYESKGKPTLDALTEGEVDSAEVNANLQLDHHTQFDVTDATVNGESFEAFLESSSAYRFVSWLVSELPYEIRDAGRRAGLSDLYEAIPEIDRIELQGAVDVDAEDGTTTRTFDVVVRNRMGDPLVVAELNDERDPVTGDEMSGLVDASDVVGEYADELSAAFYVTASFFEPDALESAAEATKTGGLLSRNDKMSYVKVARKKGYHLCLVEDRNETFHLTVPEL